MKRKGLYALLLVCGLLLAGCSEEPEVAPGIKPENRPADVEPTATYDWMAGESPVPVKRIGVVRYGVNLTKHAVSPKGMYFIEPEKGSDSYILYADHGSDTLIKLCGRVDCNHNSSDCNAYIREGSDISFYKGYLYAVSGEGSQEACSLVRMEPDGTDHVVVLDMLDFAKEHGGEFARCHMITDGFCLITTYRWLEVGSGKDVQFHEETVGDYYYKLDGSMDEPAVLKSGGILYHCGNMLRCITEEVTNGGQYGGIGACDLENDTVTYLIDHPGITGYYDEDEGYYFNNGAICRLDYATMKEEVMVETGLEGRYLLFVFPDCMVLASRSDDEPRDNHLYFYNWAFELVDQVELTYPHSERTQFLLLAETAERLILTNKDGGTPLYYINKAELGTGNVEIHSFKQA